MTQPDPSAEPAAPATPQEPTEPATGQQPAPFDPSSLSPEAKAYLKAQVDNANYKARTDAKAAAAEEAKKELAAQIAKALGQDGDEPPDPAALTAQIEHAQAAAWRSGVELQVHRLASKLGGDPEKLLDSMAFIDSLDDLTDSDPSSPAFRSEIEAKVSAALERNPAYKVAGPAGPRPDPGQGGRPPVVTDFTKADPETFAAELAKYRLRPRTY